MWNLYNRIEVLCKEQQMNITQMCRELCMPRSIMSELKAGRTIRLSAENSSKLSNFFNVPVDYFLNNAPFDVWEKINEDRDGFFYHLHVPKNTLENVWGIDKDNPFTATCGAVIRFLSSCIKSAHVDCGGYWSIEIVSEYEALWHTAIIHQNNFDNISAYPEIEKAPDAEAPEAEFQEVINLLQQLPEDKRQNALDYLKFLSSNNQ